MQKLVLLLRSDLDGAEVATKSSVAEMYADLDDSQGKKKPLNVDRKVLGTKCLVTIRRDDRLYYCTTISLQGIRGINLQRFLYHHYLPQSDSNHSNRNQGGSMGVCDFL